MPRWVYPPNWSTLPFRPGHEAQFEAAAKTYGEVSERLGADVSYRVYQVTAGMSGVNFMLFSSVADYADFDEVMAVGNTMRPNGPGLRSSMPALTSAESHDRASPRCAVHVHAFAEQPTIGQAEL